MARTPEQIDADIEVTAKLWKAAGEHLDALRRERVEAVSGPPKSAEEAALGTKANLDTGISDYEKGGTVNPPPTPGEV